MLETKWMKVATAGLTVDGREIKPEWLTSMAENYDPKDIYMAAVNIDHFSLFGSGMGHVTALKAEKDSKGRMSLYARIDPSAYLLSLWQNKDKQFFSIEPQPDFPSKGQWYLAGLAVTESPASQGLQPVRFNKGGSPEVFTNTAAMTRPAGSDFTAWEDADPATLAASETHQDNNDQQDPPWLNKFMGEIKALFGAQPTENDPMTKEELEKFKALQGQVETLSKQLSELTDKYTAAKAEETPDAGAQQEEAQAGEEKLNAETEARFTDLNGQIESLTAQVEDLSKLMAQPVEGGQGEVTGATPQGEKFVA
ncbi:MAG: GPO family capsid scaffolding protein [Deltaproteobacteria bacterium]|nr:GPO family capsid scaffolding protein [Deltaproteobacteria bacterium]